VHVSAWLHTHRARAKRLQKLSEELERALDERAKNKKLHPQSSPEANKQQLRSV
jgi:hypothetical protein